MNTTEFNFKNLMDEWSKGLSRAETIRSLSEDLMRCKSQIEVDNIRLQYWDFIEENPDCFQMIKRARIRIARISKQAKKSWNLTDMN